MSLLLKCRTENPPVLNMIHNKKHFILFFSVESPRLCLSDPSSHVCIHFNSTTYAGITVSCINVQSDIPCRRKSQTCFASNIVCSCTMATLDQIRISKLFSNGDVDRDEQPRHRSKAESRGLRNRSWHNAASLLPCNEAFMKYLLKLSSSDTRLPLCRRLVFKARTGLTQQ